MYEYRVTIDRVVDGDTVDCWIDLGYHTQIHKRIRFIGINAPETRTRNKEEKVLGLKAKEWLKQKIDPSYTGAYEEVYLKSWGLGKYGRVLGELFVQSGKSKKSITKWMLSEGLVKEYDGGKR
jgi:micrococcal nuclease|tara:strand:- start:895 stop:1263 length:369 start_codon:yes stop_codon:yes gene_type:complete